MPPPRVEGGDSRVKEYFSMINYEYSPLDQLKLEV